MTWHQTGVKPAQYIWTNEDPIYGLVYSISKKYALRFYFVAVWYRAILPGSFNRLVQDCSNSSALAMELLQSRTKPSISYDFHWSSNWKLIHLEIYDLNKTKQNKTICIFHVIYCTCHQASKLYTVAPPGCNLTTHPVIVVVMTLWHSA